MYNLYIMKRTQIYLEEAQDSRLAKRALALGVSKASLIREAVDAFLEGPSRDTFLVGRFRRALHEIAHHPLASLGDGRTYVEELRRMDVLRQQELEQRRGD